MEYYKPAPSFFKIFKILFVLNLLLATAIFFISPDKVPSKLTKAGFFEGFRDKIQVFLLSSIFPILFLLIAYNIAGFSPLMLIYPFILLLAHAKFLGFLFNKKIDKDNIVFYSQKLSFGFFLALTTAMLFIQLAGLGFAFQINEPLLYIGSILLILTLIIVLTVVFSKTAIL